MQNRKLPAGFTLVELAITISIIAILMTIGSTWFGASVRTAKERGVQEKFLQDFGWARAAAGVADASVLNPSLAGAPTLSITLNADCTWSSSVNGSTDAKHSMTTSQLSALSLSLTCSGTAVPATFVFDNLGGVGTTGSVSFTGSTNNWVLQVMGSGTVVRSRVAS
jgi:prepilin-type N-terminal cleavage/methylation domain-containing protein